MTDPTDMRKDIARWNGDAKPMSKTEKTFRYHYTVVNPMDEETMMVTWLNEVNKPEGHAAYGFDVVKALVAAGNFSTVLISADRSWKEIRQIAKLMGRHKRILLLKTPEPKAMLESFGGYVTFRVRP